MIKKSIIAVALSGIIAMNLISCTDFKDVLSKNSLRSDSNKAESYTLPKTLGDIKEKYADSEKVSYSEPYYNVSRDYVFEFKMKPEINSKIDYNPNDMYKVFADSNLTQETYAKVEYDYDKKVMKVSPPSSPIAQTEEEVKQDTSGANKNWGNVNTLYLAKYYDQETGEKLDKPVITVFTIKGELDTPTLNYSKTENGQCKFPWNAIEEAQKYVIYETTDSEYFANTTLRKIGETTETSFEDFPYKIDPAFKSEYLMNTDFKCEEETDDRYCVMAVKNDGKSLISNLLKKDEIAKTLAYTKDIDNGQYKSNYDTINSLPTQVPIEMCNGDTLLYNVVYDTQKYEATKSTLNNAIKSLALNATIYGTNFKWTVYVEHINNSTFEDDLEKLEERQSSPKTDGVIKSGDNISATPTRDIETKPEEDKSKTENNDGENVTKIEDLDGVKIFSSSALSEYLAINLIEQNENIDLSGFPESSNQELLLDAFYESKYQNPLILSAEAVSIGYKPHQLKVSYNDTKEVSRKKQKEIIAEVNKVSEEIFKDGMSDLEKELAINQYLCDSAVYDEEVLKIAEANNMQIDEKKYTDAFSAYGILVKKIGVCISYASSFKLLADSAGLDCIIATGTLCGGYNHAWNRVKIDGNWLSVDSTNNDNEQIPNALLNLKDDESKSILVEDKDYMIDSELSKYTANTDKYEYYRLNKKYQEKDKMVDALAGELESSKVTRIKTDMSLNDQEFQDIVAKLNKKGIVTASNVKAGGYQFGVVYIELK